MCFYALYKLVSLQQQQSREAGPASRSKEIHSSFINKVGGWHRLYRLYNLCWMGRGCDAYFHIWHMRYAQVYSSIHSVARVVDVRSLASAANKRRSEFKTRIFFCTSRYNNQYLSYSCNCRESQLASKKDQYWIKKEEMNFTIPTPVTDARLEFSSLVFASNLSPIPPAAVTVSPQQVQNKYWIIPVQETKYYNVLSQLCC